MLYELFEASFIDEMIHLVHEFRTSSIDDGRTLTECTGQSIAFKVGTHRYSWERSPWDVVRIVCDNIEYRTSVQSLSSKYATPDFITKFCDKFGITYLLQDNKDNAKKWVKERAKLQRGRNCGEEYVPIILRLQLSIPLLYEMYEQVFDSPEQELLRKLGQPFCERAQRQSIVTEMGQALSKEEPIDMNQPVIYSVLIGREGIKSKHAVNIGKRFSDLGLRNLQSDEEMIGLGLAVLDKVKSILQSQGKKVYIFSAPKIEYAIMPLRSPDFVRHTRDCLGGDYILELSITSQKGNESELSDW